MWLNILGFSFVQPTYVLYLLLNNIRVLIISYKNNEVLLTLLYFYPW